MGAGASSSSTYQVSDEEKAIIGRNLMVSIY